jgi:N-acetylmuramoyl-L-alanine amidase
MITANDPWRSPPRISREGFRRVLIDKANPAVAAERDPGQYWDAIRAEGVDPLFILSKFNHESTLGKFGMARTTHSWGNTRPPSFGVPHIGTDNNFSVYRTWLDGCKSTVARLVSPEWVYHNRVTIREIYIHPSGQVWAPAGDNNDPNGYLNAMIRDMNAWADGGPPMPLQPPPGWTPPLIRVSYVPAGRPNRPGTRITVRKNVWHDTGNEDEGANAEMHRRFVHNGGGAESTSYQYVVDDHEIVALIPEGEKAHHALRGCNDESNGIELCINSDGDWNLTRWNGAWLGAQLESRGITTHVQHFDCTRKHCPKKIRDAGTWDDYLARIAYFRNVPPPVEDAIHLNGFKIVLGFKSFWRELEGYERTLPYRVLGLPLANEVGAGDGVSFQEFERGWLKWSRDEPEPFHIHLAFKDDHP